MSSAPFIEFQKRRTFQSLDGLRALSVAAVAWHHVCRGEDHFFASQGALGVSLFFAISGFLITTLLLRERRRTGEVSLGAFYARRSLRIFPLYYTMLAVYVLVVALFEKDAGARAGFFDNFRYFVSYTSNWFVHAEDGPRVIFVFAWSLAAEEQFYALWPSVEKWLGAVRPRLPIVCALALGTFALADPSNAIPPSLCFGVVIAHVLDEERWYRVAALVVGWRNASPVALGLMLGFMLAPVPWSGIPITIAMAFVVASCVVNEEHALAPILRSKPLVALGRVSYGVYLMHMLIVNVVERALAKAHLDARLAVWAVALAATYAVARLSFVHYEARFLRLKERFTR